MSEDRCPHCGVDLDTWAKLADKEYVLVRREDLEKAIDFIKNTGGYYWGEVAYRLKSALDRKPTL